MILPYYQLVVCKYRWYRGGYPQKGVVASRLGTCDRKATTHDVKHPGYHFPTTTHTPR